MCYFKKAFTDVMVISGEEVALQPSAGYTVQKQALNHCPYLSKSVDMARAKLTGSKVSLSGIARRKSDAQEAIIEGNTD